MKSRGERKCLSTGKTRYIKIHPQMVHIPSAGVFFAYFPQRSSSASIFLIGSMMELTDISWLMAAMM